MSRSELPSVEHIAATVQENIRGLPFTEIHAAHDHVDRAALLMPSATEYAAAAALRGVPDVLARAGGHIVAARGHTQRVRDELRAYLRETTLQGEDPLSQPVYHSEHFTVDPGDCLDPYEEFDAIYPPQVRRNVYDLVLRLALDPHGEPIPPEHLLISGFEGDVGREELEATDRHKLSVKSAVPKGGFVPRSPGLKGISDYDFDGDDSNAANVIERDIQALRDSKLAIARDLAEDTISATDRQTLLEELKTLSDRISKLMTAKADAVLPVYYATAADELLGGDPEHNPLAYARFDDEDDVPVLAVYDRRSIIAAGLTVTRKDSTQIRILTTGADLMQHCVALIRLDIAVNE